VSLLRDAVSAASAAALRRAIARGVGVDMPRSELPFARNVDTTRQRLQQALSSALGSLA
jgi:hypothetical protein